VSSQGQRFRRRALRRGYKVDEVDSFLDRVEATLAGEQSGAPVGAQEVHDVVFRVRFGGYDEWQVDLHLDRVERQLAEFEERGPARGPEQRLQPEPARGMNTGAIPTGGMAPGGMGPGGMPADRMGASMGRGAPPTERLTAPMRDDRQMGGPMGAPQIPQRQMPALPPGGDPYGRPQYDEAPTGRPQYDEAPTGRQQYDEPPNGRPQYDEPGYGQPPMGRPQYDEPPMGRPQQYEEPPPARPQYDEPPYGQQQPPPRGPAGYDAGGYDTGSYDAFEPGRHGKSDMTAEIRMPERDRGGYGGPAPMSGPPGPPMGGGPSMGGAPAGGSPELYRVDQLRRTFQPRRFGSGYDPMQVDRLFDSILQAMSGRGPMPVPENELDTLQFGLVPGGYFEAEVDAALREVKDILLHRR
jgi:DivIVA domain-containing protein